MVTPVGSCPAGSPAAPALGASESGLYVGYALSATLVLTVGCAITVQQKPEVNLPMPSNATVLVLGELTSDKPGWTTLQPHFRKVFLQYLADRKVFATVLDDSPPPDNALVLLGSVTEVEEGDRALRALVGFGAGQMKLKGRFEVRDAAGVTLLRFESHGATYGGIGPSVAGAMQDIEGLVTGFAVNVAHTVMRWSKGKLVE